MIGPDGNFLTYPAWLKRQQRRQRLIRYGGFLAAIVLPCLLAWGVVGWLAGGP